MRLISKIELDDGGSLTITWDGESSCYILEVTDRTEGECTLVLSSSEYEEMGTMLLPEVFLKKIK